MDRHFVSLLEEVVMGMDGNSASGGAPGNCSQDEAEAEGTGSEPEECRENIPTLSRQGRGKGGSERARAAGHEP